MNHFYDGQVKRFLLQFARIFSTLEVTSGFDPAGNAIIKRVPIMYGDSSRQAAAIVANNSASNMPSAPLITYYISAIDYEQSRTQEPYFVDKLNVRQRTYNSDTTEWETTQGNAFTVERIMPVPYKLSVTVDFWTTNYLQKLEIFEQLAVLFNPSLEIQSTDNFIDWTSLSVVYQDSLNWTSRSIPQGTGNTIDILTWKFHMPIWISSPIKLKKYGVITRIISSIFTSQYRADIQDDDLLVGTRQKITPYGYKILLMDGALQVLPTSHPDASEDAPDGVAPNSNLYWKSVLNTYGVIREGISMIALENPYMETEIMGTVAFNPLDDRLLVYNIDSDTLPQNTLNAINSVIDPVKKYPGHNLPAAVAGQRYLIVEPIAYQIGYAGPSSVGPAWPGLVNGAEPNDIIEFDGTDWFVSFNSNSPTNIQFVTNLTSGIQYRFVHGENWVKSWEGYYPAGNWRIII